MVKKKTEGKLEPVDLWSIEKEATPLKDFVKDTVNVEKIIWFGPSNSGKTHAYLSVLRDYSKRKIPPKDVCMCIVFPDRSTGITKLWHLIPKEYQDRVFIFPIHDYEGLVTATANCEKILIKHFEKTKTHGWLIVELLEEAWRMAQDYYSRQAFGETLADLMSAKRRAVASLEELKDENKKKSAYEALEGWRDWTVIKFFHNFNWIDRIKKMPFNVGATSEIKSTDDEDDIFSAIKVRPAGEKDNVHRFDTVLYMKHQGNNFYQRCFKLTGYSRLYTDVDITGEDSYTMHRKITEKFEKSGYRKTKVEELEEEADIEKPKETKKQTKEETPKKKKSQKPQKQEPKKEESTEDGDDDWDEEFDL